MAYQSPFYLNWLAKKVAAEDLTIGLHTGSPGNNGTSARAKNNSNTSGVTKQVAAADITADGAVSDNDDVVEVFTPNATSAGQAISHLSYWFGTDFVGWAQLAAPVTTVQNVPFEIAPGPIDFSFAGA